MFMILTMGHNVYVRETLSPTLCHPSLLLRKACTRLCMDYHEAIHPYLDLFLRVLFTGGAAGGCVGCVEGGFGPGRVVAADPGQPRCGLQGSRQDTYISLHTA
jgi:hypothetical protein